MIHEAAAVRAHVIEVAVAVVIGDTGRPADRRVQVGREPPGKRDVTGPAHVLGEQDDEQKRRVDRAVVRRALRDLARARELAHAKLVQDLARFRVPELVDPVGLVAREQEERVARDLALIGEQLEADDRGVAAEERREPRHPGREEAMPVELGLQKPQVAERALDDGVEELVRRANAGEPGKPIAPRSFEDLAHAGMPHPARVDPARTMRRDRRRYRDGDVGLLAGRERETEACAIAMQRARTRREGDGGPTPSAVDAIGPKHDGVRAPDPGLPERAAWAWDQTAQDEDVVERRSPAQLDRESGGHLAEVAHPVQLVQRSILEKPLPADRDRVLRDRAPSSRVRDLGAREVVERLVTACRGRGERDRRLALEGELVPR